MVRGRLDGAPAWAAPPLAVLWAVRGDAEAGDGRLGWLVVGDVPTDFLVESAAADPRGAVAAFAARWRAAAAAVAAGASPPPGLDVGPRAGWPSVSRLLTQRADAFARWAADDARW
jgi:hypothetical protein